MSEIDLLTKMFDRARVKYRLQSGNGYTVLEVWPDTGDDIIFLFNQHEELHSLSTRQKQRYKVEPRDSE